VDDIASSASVQKLGVNTTSRKGFNLMSDFVVRQGDVLIERIDSIPTEAKPVKVKGSRIILVREEATGHHHSVPSRGVQLLERPTTTEADEKFLRIMEKSGVGLEHQEHATITIPPGDYKVSRQREFTSADMAPVPVTD
jgi:hypothetical protein